MIALAMVVLAATVWFVGDDIAAAINNPAKAVREQSDE